MAAIPLNRASSLQASWSFLRAGVSALRSWIQSMRGKCLYLLAHPGFRRFPPLTLFRLFLWRLHCALGIPAIVNLSRWRSRFYLPPHWHGAGTTMIFALRERYEKELTHLDRFLSPGMVVVDGGANCGIYSIAAAKLVGPSGLVLSFEPGSETFSVLEKNVRLNYLSNVRPYQAALSDKEGNAPLFHHKHGPNSFSLGSKDEDGIESEEVATRTLNKVLVEQGLERIGFIKLDVEGAEELVLRGAEKTLAHSHPTIFFEINAEATKRLGLSPIGSWELLEGLGYEFFSLTECGDLLPLNRPPVVNDALNVVAIHGGLQK